jgi:hypothetical protein
MMEDLINQISDWIPTAGGEPASTHTALPLSYICCVLGALILSKFTGSIGALTVPVNAAALFVGASLVTMMTSHLDLPIDRSLEQPLLATLAGMTIASLVMMAWMKRDGSTFHA